jgi:translation initiation factor IF-1
MPNALFRIRLDGGECVTANLATPLRHQVVRLIVGDRVNVKLSRHDPKRGRVTGKK